MLLKNAITMTGTIDKCWLLTYRVPEDEVADLVPVPLRLDTFGGFAFFNIVVSHLREMRPKGLPGWTGLSYWHVAYRLHVAYGTEEGLFFLRSDADSMPMTLAGTLLTDFKFHHTNVTVVETDGVEIRLHTEGANLELSIDHQPPTRVAPGSPFGSLTEAAEFLKYKPAAFFVKNGRVEILRITREETAWKSKLVQVPHESVAFLDGYDAQPEICFEVEPISYVWNRAEKM